MRPAQGIGREGEPRAIINDFGRGGRWAQDERAAGNFRRTGVVRAQARGDRADGRTRPERRRTGGVGDGDAPSRDDADIPARSCGHPWARHRLANH